MARTLAVLEARLDHVALAVGDTVAAERRWRDALGGLLVARYARNGYVGTMYRYGNGTYLELLAPDRETGTAPGFLHDFLARFGPWPHHVTIKVSDVAAAANTLEDAGLTVVGLDLDAGYGLEELFLRPSEVGGIVVQVSHSAQSYEELGAEIGLSADPQPTDSAALRGLLLTHTDPDATASVWELLGGSVSRWDGGLVVQWPLSGLHLEIISGEKDGPVALLFEDLDLPFDQRFGAATERPRAVTTPEVTS